MNTELREVLFQSNSMGLGYNVTTTFSASGEAAPIIQESVGGMGVSDVYRYSIPSMRPYGFASYPNPNTLQVVMPSGPTTNNPIVLGHLDVTSKPWSLAVGESAMYSNAVAFKVSNTAAKYYFGGMTATALNGEQINQIIADIITYLQGQFESFQAQIVSVYNDHYHVAPENGGNTSGPIATIPSPPPFPGNLVSDLQAVETGSTLIDTETQGA